MANGSKKPMPERWYYDSCTLDQSKGAYGEMFSKKHPKQPVISHLAFGEAFANSFRKGKEQVDAFVDLMSKLRDYIEIVENDTGGPALERVRAKFPALSITDALHVATAIRSECVCVRTLDRDLHGLSSKEVNELGEEFSMPRFSITEMTYK